MSVSSLQKKMFTGKMLVFSFLVGLLSLTFLVFKISNVFAATSAPIAPTSTSAVTAQSITYNWTADAGFSGSKWVVASSTNRVPTAAQIAVITNTSTVSFTVNGLATNTAYYLGAAGGDAAGATSSYATSSLTYTLADTPGTPTLSAATAQGFTVTINSSSNVVAATTYIVRDTAQATLQYLQSNGTWGASSNTTFTAVQLGAINGTSTTGLATNTLHRISVAAVNGDNVTTSFSASADIMTLADTPGAPTLSAATAQGFTVTINSSSNPATTTFIVRDTAQATLQYLQSDGTWGASSGTTFTAVQLGAINGTSTTGLATNTIHRISVAAVNGDRVTTTFSSAVDIITLAATPGTPTLSAAALTSFTVTINSSSNPATTTYVVRDTGGTTLQYLQSDGTWGTSSSTTFTAVQLGAINGTSTTGLSANTTHTISVAAVNGDRVTSSFSSAATIYTLANTPSSVSLSGEANGFTLSWSGESTNYWVIDETANTNSGLISSRSYSVGGINCGTTRTFSVSGRNGDNVATATSTSVTGTTNACGSSGSVGGGGGGGGGASITPAIPAVPTTAPAVPSDSLDIPSFPATPASVSLPSTASPVAVFVQNLGPGSKGAEVKKLQARLRELGFFKHPTDTGLFGAVTKAAVVAFQKAQGFKTAPGSVGPATRAALNSESAVSAGESSAPVPAVPPQAQAFGEFISNLRVGSKGNEVKALQAKLRELGFFTYPTDTGTFGPATRAAVIAFQKDQGFATAPGHVGPATRAALNSL
ncbi:MAG: hypothetical protein G01um101413_909 [Parcubacteria group bacterium Gr01-1014_13]|nr:MAG: hypothetical protein G01um101413_909 [Parcubacteria group bacterium Gr01-1014_13]